MIFIHYFLLHFTPLLATLFYFISSLKGLVTTQQPSSLTNCQSEEHWDRACHVVLSVWPRTGLGVPTNQCATHS